MSSWREAKSLLKLRDQVNAMWPNRDKTSDGEIGDMAHALRKSDHNPWVKDAHGIGVVTAQDIDRELGGQPDGSNAGDTVAILVGMLQASLDRRIKYLIWNAQITVKGDISRWKPYDGENAHKHHCHISVSSDPVLYDDDRDWKLKISTVTATPTLPADIPAKITSQDTHSTATQPPSIILKTGASGGGVRKLQNMLVTLGFLHAANVDGSFGPITRQAVIAAQTKFHLTADGIVGPDTLRALGLIAK